MLVTSLQETFDRPAKCAESAVQTWQLSCNTCQQCLSQVDMITAFAPSVYRTGHANGPARLPRGLLLAAGGAGCW